MNDIYLEDNFFQNPDFVRNWALQSKYNFCDFTQKEIFSGYRALIPHNDRIELINGIQKITSKKIKTLYCNYHLNPQISMHGVPHIDAKKKNMFAGVVYLNQTTPIENCGTTIYKDPLDDIDLNRIIPDYRSKMQILYCTFINTNNNIKKQFSQDFLNLKNSLQTMMSVENKFNRIICYPANLLHSPDFYFGSSMEDSRLTIAFHGEFEDAI